MTDREKAIAMAYTGIAMLIGDKFDIFHKYVEEIMCRPVFSHEFATCAEEIKEKAKPDFLKLCAEEEQERQCGEWEKYGDIKEAYDIEGNKSWGQMRRCTNCGFIKTYIEDFGFYSICPNCGADMRGKKDDLAEIIEAARNMKDGEQNEKQSRNEI